MYTTRANLVLGFHGCDKTTAEKIVREGGNLIPSQNDYDWLGHGVYFWENNPERALEFVTERHHNIQIPAIIGAVINLGFCLDLLESRSIQLLKDAYNSFRQIEHKGHSPENKPAGSSRDVLLRYLDCAVIEHLHNTRAAKGSNALARSFDSIRAVFPEGNELYPNAGFREKNHIQICIRNPNCIKGYFIPRVISQKYPAV